MKLLEYILKHKIISCSIILSVIFIPIFVIHFLFSIYPNNTLWIAKWSAGELLNYFGSILGAVATIIAVVITIAYTKHSQDEQNILQVKPYLQSKSTEFTTLADLSEKELSKYTFITIQQGVIISEPEKSLAIKSINSDTYTWEHFYRDNLVIKYTIRNIGANTATKIKWTLKNTPIIYDFAISKDEANEFVIIINESSLNENEYVLDFEFKYNDVLDFAEYSQKELITILKLGSQMYFTQTKSDMLTSPKRIN